MFDGEDWQPVDYGYLRGWNEAIKAAAELADGHDAAKERQAKGQRLGDVRRQVALTQGDDAAEAAVQCIQDEERGEKIAAEHLAAAIRKLKKE